MAYEECSTYLSIVVYTPGRDPNDVTAILGLTPFRIARRGERNRERNIPKENFWSFRTEGSSTNINDHWLQVAPYLKGEASRLKRQTAGMRVKVNIVATLNGQIPNYDVPVGMIQFLSELEVELGIAFYDMNAEGRPGWDGE